MSKEAHESVSPTCGDLASYWKAAHDRVVAQNWELSRQISVSTPTGEGEDVRKIVQGTIFTAMLEAKPELSIKERAAHCDRIAKMATDCLLETIPVAVFKPITEEAATGGAREELARRRDSARMAEKSHLRAGQMESAAYSRGLAWAYDNTTSLVPLQGGERAIAEIAAERRRQIEAECWTPEHDDEHEKGELAQAAACYARLAANPDSYFAPEPCPMDWPWEASWWKPTDARRDLVKAGALIAAEIERLDRATAPTSPSKIPGEEA